MNTLSKDDVRKAILVALYLYEFGNEGQRNLEELRKVLDVPEIAYTNIVDKMVHDGLIKAWTAGHNYQILPAGIVAAEQEGFPPNELVTNNNQIRTKILDLLATLFDSKGRFANESIATIAAEVGVNERSAGVNLQLLSDLGYVENFAASTYKITFQGLESVEEWRGKVALSDEFGKIRDLQPHERGRKFQALVGNMLNKNGWSSEVSVRTSHEEMDVVFTKGREYYLVECKWESDPVEAPVVRELFGKLSNRVGVVGAIFSMSGFTRGAIEQAKEYASRKIIIFFGPGDFAKLVDEGQDFDEMLAIKYKAYVTRTKVEYS